MSKEFFFATIGTVYSDGVSLIFDGTDIESQKHYKVNTSVTFKAGDRVKILPTSGTYVVEYVVGNPGSNSGGDESSSQIPSGGAAGSVLVKNSAADGDVAWGAASLAVKDCDNKNSYIWLRYKEGTGYQIARTGSGWTNI